MAFNYLPLVELKNSYYLLYRGRNLKTIKYICRNQFAKKGELEKNWMCWEMRIISETPVPIELHFSFFSTVPLSLSFPYFFSYTELHSLFYYFFSGEWMIKLSIDSHSYLWALWVYKCTNAKLPSTAKWERYYVKKFKFKHLAAA